MTALRRRFRIVGADDLRVVLADEATRLRLEYLQGVKKLWPLTRRYWFDALILAGAIVATLEVALKLDSGPAPKGPLWLETPATLLIFLPLLARRWFPFGAPASIFLYLGALSFADGRLVTYTFTAFLLVLACSFLFGLLGDRRQSLVGIAIAIGAAEIVGYNNPRQHLGDYFFVPLVFGISWLAGFGLGGKLRQVARAEERVLRLELERERSEERAVAEERQRIARELHDVIAHSVSVMTVQAGAVRRLLLPEQEREREALLSVEATGRQALTEMRRLVGLLKEDSVMTPYSPLPSMKALDVLVDTLREAGLPVELAVEGEQRELAPGVDLAAYRVVQEALTNALKYAGPARAWVTVRWDRDELELAVENDGRNDIDGQDGGGHGLVGMKERVAVVGGTLESGPRSGGGFVVKARIPIGGQA